MSAPEITARCWISTVAVSSSLWLVIMLTACALLSGCTSGMSNLSPTFMESLAHDPNSSCIIMGAIPPYFGGFYWVRQSPNGGNGVECGAAKITGTIASPTMLVAPGTQAPSVISLTPPPPAALPPPSK